MDGNRPAAVFASIEQIGIGQVGDVPDAGQCSTHSGDARLRREGGGLAGRVGFLERRQVDAADRELEGEALRPPLDRALGELGRARLNAHRVDGPDAREPRLAGDRFEDLGAAGAGVTQESLLDVT
jgi:hypothetical protein